MHIKSEWYLPKISQFAVRYPQKYIGQGCTLLLCVEDFSSEGNVWSVITWDYSQRDLLRCSNPITSWLTNLSEHLSSPTREYYIIMSCPNPTDNKETWLATQSNFCNYFFSPISEAHTMLVALGEGSRLFQNSLFLWDGLTLKPFL